MKSATKQFTLRLPNDLYERSVRMARRYRVSLNELTRKSLQRLTEEEGIAELEAAYNLIGSDSDADVEVFLAAQREVVLGDE